MQLTDGPNALVLQLSRDRAIGRKMCPPRCEQAVFPTTPQSMVASSRLLSGIASTAAILPRLLFLASHSRGWVVPTSYGAAGGPEAPTSMSVWSNVRLHLISCQYVT